MLDRRKTGYKIAYLMMEKGYTITDLSIKTGVAETTIVSWRNGRKMPRLDMLVDLADIFGVTVDEILVKKVGV